MEANAGEYIKNYLHLKRFPRISLHCKLVPVQYWEYEYGLLVLSISFSGTSGYISSSKAFIYSLRNYYGYGYFKNDVTNPSAATYSYYNYGPTFGGGHDIYLANNAGPTNNNYNACSSYRSRYCNKYVFTGTYWFTPSNVEVYYEAFST